MLSRDQTVYGRTGKVEEYREYLLEALPHARTEAIVYAVDIARYMTAGDFSARDESLEKYLKFRRYVTAIEDALELLKDDGTSR